MQATFETAKNRGHKSFGSTRAGPSPHPSAAQHPILALQQQAGNQAVQELLRQAGIHPKLAISQPDDPEEREADQVADRVMRMPDPGVFPAAISPVLSRKCAACDEEEEQKLARQSQGAPATAEATAPPPIVQEALSSSGQPLDAATRAFFEPRFGHHFSDVRIHTGTAAAESARSVSAHAYTVGQRIVFGAGSFHPDTAAGRRLLAHELTHVVQQGGAGPFGNPLPASPSGESYEEQGERSTVTSAGLRPCGSMGPAAGQIQRQGGGTDSARADAGQGGGAAGVTGGGGGTPKPKTCPAPPDLECRATKASVAGVSKTIQFVVDRSDLDRRALDDIHDAAKSWHAAGEKGTVRVDGYASAQYECVYNWRLSCRRAQAVADELRHPTDGSTGVPSPNILIFAHGESDEAGPALVPNQRATISLPAVPTKPVIPAPLPSAGCRLPASIGIGRTGCGTGSDFTHFDFPSISRASEIKLAAWAAAHGATSPVLIPLIGLPLRSKVSNAECELEMAAVLTGFAGSTGLNAFSRFKAGSGGTETHGASSTLGKDALASGSFARTLAAVKHSIESQLAIQAASGKLDACALSVVPPATHFFVSDGMTLKAVIGGTHGESLNATAFTGDIPTRTYSISLEFLICDNFGVDEADLYAPGLFAFWVLQHERSATLYAPFINLLDLPVTVSGKF